MGYPKPLHWWTDNVLPLVYDESLSYYEVMSKIVTYINGITKDTVELENLVNELKELIENAGIDTIPQIIERLDNLDGVIATLQGDNAQNKEDIADLKTDNTQNKEDIADLKTDNAQNKEDIAELKSDIENLETIPNSIKIAMDTLFSKTAYVDDEAANSYGIFHEWVLTRKVLTSITAVFTQGDAVILNTDNLDTLKQYLVVTANYSDDTSVVISDYTLSGALETGTSVITVSYYGNTDTFNVTVESVHIAFIACRGVYVANNIITFRPFPKKNRSVGLAQNGNTVQMQITGGGDSGYYMIPIPAGATAAKLTKPSDIIWNLQICHYDNNMGWIRDVGLEWGVVQELSVTGYNDGTHYACINIAKRGSSDVMPDENYDFTDYDFTNFSLSFI